MTEPGSIRHPAHEAAGSAHSHAHTHAHGHGHSHAPRDFGRAFAIGIAANVAFVAIEAGWGAVSGSLALLADAGHNLSDVLGLALAWGATHLARREPTAKRTYGFRRGSILAALANALLLVVAVGAIGTEAIGRLRHPQPVAGGTVLAVAGIGILVNLGTALLFRRGRERDVNVRGAYLHMVADAAVSLGVVLAGFAILRTGLAWIDPAVSLAVAAVILAGTWGLLRESLDLAL
ncbi:MAG TPA: cation diffusion facilitator family transporter, partial [Thermoanaerobaculia bacterium]|nr:cation diffusion facilitator family transporter [Thermoanaerobaculia bacterium]